MLKLLSRRGFDDCSGRKALLLVSLAVWAAAMVFSFAGVSTFAEELPLPTYSEVAGLTILRIEVSGNNRTREHVIVRELQSAVGDSLDLDRMADDLKRLTKIPAFSKVEIVPRREGSGVVYAVAVIETTHIIGTVLPGHSEENGWYAGPMISTPNWFGRAVTASVSAQWGGLTKYSFSANNPWISVAKRQLSVSFGTTYQDREDKIRESDERSFVAGTRSTFYPGRNRIFSLGLGFQYMAVESDKPGVTLSTSNRDDLLRFELLLRANSIADPLEPTNGWVAGIQAMRTGGFLGGDGDTWRTQVDLARYQPVTVRTSLAVGTVFKHQSGEIGQDLPEYLKYTLGGSNSVRGYSSTDLGKILYGSKEWLSTVELTYRLVDPHQVRVFGKSFLSFRVGLNLVTFVDYGIDWTTKGELNMDRSRTGYGVGLHLMVPGIDRIRLDLAFDEDGNATVHIGTKSKLDAHR